MQAGLQGNANAGARVAKSSLDGLEPGKLQPTSLGYTPGAASGPAGPSSIPVPCTNDFREGPDGEIEQPKSALF
jgi:hypothetical protein